MKYKYKVVLNGVGSHRIYRKPAGGLLGLICAWRYWSTCNDNKQAKKEILDNMKYWEDLNNYDKQKNIILSVKKYYKPEDLNEDK